MALKVKQVSPVEVWPSGEGWVVGLLEATPDNLSERFGIAFETGRDDLDSYRIAAIAEPQVGQFWLFAHDRAPIAGTEVIVDEAVSRDIALGSVARALGLDIRSFAWVSPYSEFPSPESDAPMSQPAALYAENGGADDRVAEATRRLAAREREIGELRRKLRDTQNRLHELEHPVAAPTDTRG